MKYLIAAVFLLMTSNSLATYGIGTKNFRNTIPKPVGDISARVVCIEGYKFAVVWNPEHRIPSVVQIFEKGPGMSAPAPQPASCE